MATKTTRTAQPAKIHRSLRVDAKLDAEAKKIAAKRGTSENSVYEELLSIGLTTLTNGKYTPPANKKETQEPEPGQLELLETMREYNQTLRDQLDRANEQLITKDQQITALLETTKAAQSLHAMTETKAIEATSTPAAGQDQRRGGFFSRIFSR